MLTVLCLQAVVLNVRLKSNDARLLGIEMHICEVQLLLAELVDLQVRARGRLRLSRVYVDEINNREGCLYPSV